MRRALNENPVVQIALLAVLAIGVAFLLMTRLGGDAEEPAAPPATSGSAAPATGAPAGAPAAGGTVAPSTTGQPPAGAVPAVPAVPASPSASATGFSAGPGLPKQVASAYEDGKTIVLFVHRRKGLDDLPVRFEVKLLQRLRGAGLSGSEGSLLDQAALFTTHAHKVARYSRIALGVNLDRAPALIVVQPRKRAGAVPTATVSYGFRGLPSVVQAIKDALYRGRTLPYHPE